MARLREHWLWVLAVAGLVGGAVVGHAAAAPPPPAPVVWQVSELQCPSTTLCLGVLSDGAAVPGPNLVMSRAPRSGRWGSETIGTGHRLRMLTCRSAHWCLAVDQENRVLISTAPARGARSWRVAGGGPGRHLDNVQQLSCPGVHLCVGLAGHYVVSSVGPQRGGAAWSQRLVNPNAPAFTLDCPAINRCVAASAEGQLLTTSDPTGRNAWKISRLDRSARDVPSASVSCASAAQCVAGFGDGRVFATSNLTAGAPRWDHAQVGPRRLATRPVDLSVSCTTDNVCAAVADASVWASAAPGLSGRRRWRQVAIDTATTGARDRLSTVACVAGDLCVAIDQAGHVLSSNAITQPGSWRRQTMTLATPTG